MPIGFEVDNHIATLIIDGYNDLNPVDYPMLFELGKRFEEIDRDPDIRVAILRGAGDKHFCAGYNLKLGNESIKADEDRERYDAAPFYYLGSPEPIRNRPLIPVIGAARGWCLGGAMLLFGMNTDIRIAGESTKFGCTEMKVGLAGATAMSRMPLQLPYATFMWMASTGEHMDAETAYRVGYVNEVVPDEQVMVRAREVAEMIAEIPPLSLRAEKWAMLRGETVSHARAVDYAMMLAALNCHDKPTVAEMKANIKELI